MITSNYPHHSGATRSGPSPTTAETLRARGLRLTRPRRIILDVVRATDAHPTAASVYPRVPRPPRAAARGPRDGLPDPPDAGRAGAARRAGRRRGRALRRQHGGPRPLHVPRARPDLRRAGPGAARRAGAHGLADGLRGAGLSHGVLRALRRMPPAPRPITAHPTEEDVMAGKSLKGTKSHENLKEAFAGESQANRRYLYFARVADIEDR